jgi:hypothetical protein
MWRPEFFVRKGSFDCALAWRGESAPVKTGERFAQDDAGEGLSFPPFRPLRGRKDEAPTFLIGSQKEPTRPADGRVGHPDRAD